MKKLLSTFLATSMVMAACVATASTASAAVPTVTLPIKNGEFHTWEAEAYVSEFIQQGGSTPEADIVTATVTGASGGMCIHDGTVTPTSAENPVKLVLPIYVPHEIVYEMEVVTGPNTIVHNKNYFTLDGNRIFQTNGGSASVTCEPLDWKGKDSSHYVATKYTTQITIPAGNHEIAFVIPPRGGQTYGGMMLDYIKLTSLAPETIIDCRIDIEDGNYVGKYFILNDRTDEPSINMLIMLATYDENNVMTAITPVPVVADATYEDSSISLPMAGTSKARMFLWSGTDYLTAGETAYIDSVVVNNE